MLANQTLRAFIPTVKRLEAKTFYQDILGLSLISEDEYALEFNSNGVLLRVTTVPDLVPHQFTSLGWNVSDIVSIIRELNKKGVFCERYNYFEQDDLGVWKAPSGTKVAWFKDPDGNVLSLTEPMSGE